MYRITFIQWLVVVFWLGVVVIIIIIMIVVWMRPCVVNTVKFTRSPDQHSFLVVSSFESKFLKWIHAILKIEKCFLSFWRKFSCYEYPKMFIIAKTVKECSQQSQPPLLQSCAHSEKISIWFSYSECLTQNNRISFWFEILKIEIETHHHHRTTINPSCMIYLIRKGIRLPLYSPIDKEK